MPATAFVITFPSILELIKIRPNNSISVDIIKIVSVIWMFEKIGDCYARMRSHSSLDILERTARYGDILTRSVVILPSL